MATYRHITMALPVDVADRLQEGAVTHGLSKHQILVQAIDHELDPLEEQACEAASMELVSNQVSLTKAGGVL